MKHKAALIVIVIALGAVAGCRGKESASQTPAGTQSQAPVARPNQASTPGVASTPGRPQQAAPAATTADAPHENHAELLQKMK